MVFADSSTSFSTEPQLLAKLGQPNVNSTSSYAAKQSRLREQRLKEELRRNSGVFRLSETDITKESTLVVASAVGYAAKQIKLREQRLKQRQQQSIKKESTEEVQPLEAETKPQEADQLPIRNLNDVANVVIDVIHDIFYHPTNGFWASYDESFDREYFIKFGKVGWDAEEDSSERSQAREFIEKQRIGEVQKVLQNPFVIQAIDQVQASVAAIVSGVPRAVIERAIENHIFDHLYYLIYESPILESAETTP